MDTNRYPDTHGSKSGGVSVLKGLAIMILLTGLGLLLLAGMATDTAAAQSTAPDCGTVSYATDAGGSYEVTNVSQLQCMGNASTGTSLNDDFVLTQDIDASGTEQWNGGNGFNPVGTDSSRFAGTFDGANNTIADLKIDRTSGAVGLFGSTGTNAEIEDVTLTAADVTYGSTDGGGVLAGTNRGTVTNVIAGGTVTVTDGRSDAGGLIGLNEGTVGYSDADVDVSGEPGSTGFVGGLVGTQQSGGTVHNSSATGDVLTDSSRVGGLVGSNGQFGVAVIRDSYATGDVEGTSNVGGLAGDQQSFDAVTQRSYATGNVTGNDSNVGGLVGDQY
ncbi:hypothetical protein EGH25_03330 [Haladaptatus sp. F3-133]|uniref:GLUG domain-containing protein n=1 Tax=Halorutilus salinus TaxID=2487751 RepID=A0A9Q4C3N8_9EURY|nr:GLUG motif-containing protein [Halorutilus salinus]MCX2818384.1 hypothetical protein [Halorutilus salinus]